MSTFAVFRRGLLLATLSGLALSPSLLAQQPAAPSGAAAIKPGVILGNAPTATDEPTVMQTARCLKGFELYKHGTVNKLLVTGGYTIDYISEARMAKIALVTYGVAPDDIIEDVMAATTKENAIYAAKLFEQLGWSKTTYIISQAFHLPRAGGNFRDSGLQVMDGTAADTVTAPGDFALVPDMTGDTVKVDPTDLLVVYEPYMGTEPVDWPTAVLAHRLRVAASLFHKKAAPTIVLFNDRYTRGPVNLAQMMKIALMSLGVPAANIKVIARGQYRMFNELAAAFPEKTATVITASKFPPFVRTDTNPKWKFVTID
jgi:vancomycin permeability regulator SanA